MKPLTEEHLAIFRRHMVEIIEMHFELAGDELGERVLEPALKRALLDVPRHLFVPLQLAGAAYQDTPLPIGFDKTLSQPFIGALMLDLLELTPGTRVLEVGTGLGYQAAVMAEMGTEVFTVDVVEEFAEAAKARFEALGYAVEVRAGDGARGWAEHAPFEAILVTAAAPEPPDKLLEQLAPGGRMVIPLGEGEVQQLSVVEKPLDGLVAIRALMPVRFTQLELGG
jgi:protein-L-isoaspartate(D-aspartate) O-methyltransferase